MQNLASNYKHSSTTATSVAQNNLTPRKTLHPQYQITEKQKARTGSTPAPNGRNHTTQYKYMKLNNQNKNHAKSETPIQVRTPHNHTTHTPQSASKPANPKTKPKPANSHWLKEQPHHKTSHWPKAPTSPSAEHQESEQPAAKNRSPPGRSTSHQRAQPHGRPVGTLCTKILETLA